MPKILILFRGLPGSGKSTLAQNLCDAVLSADDYFHQPSINGWKYQFNPEDIRDAHKRCISNTEVALKRGLGRVGVANTFTQEWEMKPYFDLAEKYGYTISTVIVENRHRSSNTHGVPSEVIQGMKDRFDLVL